MKHIQTKKIPNTTLLFIIIAPFTILFYASYVFNPVHMGNVWLYFLQLFADTIAITNVGALWLTIILDVVQPEHHKRNLLYDPTWIQKNTKTVDVLVPVSSEPFEIIEETIQKVLHITYPHNTYILDDGASSAVKRLAEKEHINYIARPSQQKSFAKAGNLNYGLASCTGEFFAVLDADHVPQPEFITELLPFFKNEKVALVQAPQYYTNTKNFIAAGTAEAQEIFYKYVQPAKNSYNASFCVGTNMLLRRKAIDEIGGIASLNHSEDIWTTILLHEKNWESVFYNKILTKGRAPETIVAFFRQQSRWALGGFSLFFTHNPLFNTKLTADQKVQYFFTTIHYFTAFSMCIYIFLPIIYLLTNSYPLDILNSADWPIHYIPYFITIYFLPFFLLGKLTIATASTALASFSPYLQAFISILLKNKYTWIATGTKKKKAPIIMQYIWSHVFIISLSLFAILVGWYNVYDTLTTTIISFWTLINAYLLFAFLKNGLAYQEENI